jgi:hypothetical protein
VTPRLAEPESQQQFFDYEYLKEFEAVLEFIGSINLALVIF